MIQFKSKFSFIADKNAKNLLSLDQYRMLELILIELNTQIRHPVFLARPLFYIACLQSALVFIISCKSAMVGLNSSLVRLTGAIAFLFVLFALCGESFTVDDCNVAFANFRQKEKAWVADKLHASRLKSLRKVEVQNGWICFSLNRAVSANLLKFCFDTCILILFLYC